MAKSKRADGRTSANGKRPAPAPRRRLVPAALRWLAVAAVWSTVAVGLLLAWYATDLPDLDQAIAATRRPAVTVLAADGSELATAGDLYGLPVEVRDLPPALPTAVLAIEDRRFYGHFGIDVIGLARALVVNVRAGAIVQGGSTITQQAAKNLFLSPERTLKRKVQELMLALWLERRFKKDQILAIYLNRAYFGAGTYGVDAAARKYFAVPAARVSTYQAAMLAGLLRAPSRYNPRADPGLADRRARQVLASMVDAGFLSAREAETALAYKGAVLAGRGGGSGRYFVDWVLELVPDFVSAQDKDIVVTTTLDPRLQRLAEHRLREVLAGPGAKAGIGQAALVAMTPGGAVRAMVGGRDYGESQYNRAVQARRQPGSAFKPFVFLAGLEAGMSPETRVIDGPLSVNGWQPRNFSGAYAGEVTLADALAQSINTVAVQVSERAGRRRVVDVARRLGVAAEMSPSPSLALGTEEVSLLGLTTGYAVFARGGLGVLAYAVETIHDADGRLLYRRAGSGPGRMASAEDAAAMTWMLEAAVRSGTGRAARLTRPAAGKTGTSQNFRDAWFVGFTADYVSGVWMGNDDDRPSRGVTGGGLPARLWQAFMADAHEGLQVRPLPGMAPRPAPPPASTPPAQPPPRRDFFERLKDVFATEEQ